jgi:hypothetical protein
MEITRRRFFGLLPLVAAIPATVKAAITATMNPAAPLDLTPTLRGVFDSPAVEPCPANVWAVSTATPIEDMRRLHEATKRLLAEHPNAVIMPYDSDARMFVSPQYLELLKRYEAQAK